MSSAWQLCYVINVMAHYLLAPFGSGGDVNPFVWLGKLLKARGHDVEVITAPMFRESASRADLPFTAVGDEAEYEALLKHPDLWKPLAGTNLVFEEAGRLLRPFYDAISGKVRPGETVVVAPFTQMAARLVREKFHVPLVTVHLQPVCMLSADDFPVIIPGTDWMRKLPRFVKKAMLSMPNPADFKLGPPLRKLGAEIGVKVPLRLMSEWMHSPDANLALFPEWFAAPQNDWPAKTHAVGFPLEDLRGQFRLPESLELWMNLGDKPVLLSAGTGNAQAADFFEAGLAACEKVGRRALVGTLYPEQLLDPLPRFARHFSYLPFSELLPRVAAFAHHGGIGTMSQAFAAGVPQLVMPMSHDQPDNARRMADLGVGVALGPKDFTAEKVATALEHLTTDQKVAAACAHVAERCAADRAGVKALEVLEGVGASRK